MAKNIRQTVHVGYIRNITHIALLFHASSLSIINLGIGRRLQKSVQKNSNIIPVVPIKDIIVEEKDKDVILVEDIGSE